MAWALDWPNNWQFLGGFEQVTERILVRTLERTVQLFGRLGDARH